jgi:hypothetical protein
VRHPRPTIGKLRSHTRLHAERNNPIACARWRRLCTSNNILSVLPSGASRNRCRAGALARITHHAAVTATRAGITASPSPTAPNRDRRRDGLDRSQHAAPWAARPVQDRRDHPSGHCDAQKPGLDRLQPIDRPAQPSPHCGCGRSNFRRELDGTSTLVDPKVFRRMRSSHRCGQRQQHLRHRARRCSPGTPTPRRPTISAQ